MWCLAITGSQAHQLICCICLANIITDVLFLLLGLIPLLLTCMTADNTHASQYQSLLSPSKQEKLERDIHLCSIHSNEWYIPLACSSSSPNNNYYNSVPPLNGWQNPKDTFATKLLTFLQPAPCCGLATTTTTTTAATTFLPFFDFQRWVALPKYSSSSHHVGFIVVLSPLWNQQLNFSTTTTTATAPATTTTSSPSSYMIIIFVLSPLLLLLSSSSSSSSSSSTTRPPTWRW